jgi:hypothetical protein
LESKETLILQQNISDSDSGHPALSPHHMRITKIESRQEKVTREVISVEAIEFDPAEKPKEYKFNFDEVEDFLDIDFLEKSLSKKFNGSQSPSPSPSQPLTPQAIQMEDILNIERLDEGLQKFEQSQNKMSKNSSSVRREMSTLRSKKEEKEE